MDKKAKNIVWQDTKVSYEQRCKILKQRGLVVWFTGLSGAGKSTIAIEVEKIINEKGKAVYLLDADNVRYGINSDLGFDDKDRNENIRRISEIAALFQDAGIITLCAFISPYAKMREFARKKIGTDNFIEVYVKTDLSICMERDPKGLYQRKIDNFTGISAPYEVPSNAEICIDTAKLSIQESADIVVYQILLRLSKL